MLSVLRDALLPVKHRAFAVKLYRDRQNQKYRRQDDQKNQRRNNIKHSFEEQAALLLFQNVIVFPYFVGLHFRRKLLPFLQKHS